MSNAARRWPSAKTREEALAASSTPTPPPLVHVEKKKCSWCRRPCVDGQVFTTLGGKRLLFHRRGFCLVQYKRYMMIG